MLSKSTELVALHEQSCGALLLVGTMFKKHLRYDHSTTKDGLGRANTLHHARLRVHLGKAYLMFRIPYEEALSTTTLKELQGEGWKEYHSHALEKNL